MTSAAAMPLQEILTFAFLATNGVRVLAYTPQVVALLRCRAGGGTDVSALTWALFTVSNLATTLYAWVVLLDVMTALLFGINVACCAAITGLALRCRDRRGSPKALAPAGLRADAELADTRAAPRSTGGTARR